MLRSWRWYPALSALWPRVYPVLDFSRNSWLVSAYASLPFTRALWSLPLHYVISSLSASWQRRQSGASTSTVADGFAILLGYTSDISHLIQGI